MSPSRAAWAAATISSFTPFGAITFARILRHELTHALLHSVLKDVPLWLDEGLAEYFELPIEAKGANRQHLLVMQQEGFKPDLGRLEQLSQVSQMNPAEYREAWAWVHFMLRGNPESRKVLLAYIQQLKTTSSPGALQPRLKSAQTDLNNALMVHLLAHLIGRRFETYVGGTTRANPADRRFRRATACSPRA